MSVSSYFKGKSVLITGGTGTVGSALTRALLKLKPEKIRIYSRDETKQFEMQQELCDYPDIMRYFIGDVRDLDRFKQAIETTEIIFHAAALKHVPACEYNPFEALKTNVVGTQNVIDAAIATKKVEKVIYISTDKATHPSNTMGVSKLFAERLVSAANGYKGLRKVVFSGVRFGNVMGSRGSLIPLVKKQIETQDYVTLTDPTMSRFVLSIGQATDLVLKSAELAQGGEIFILKMPVVNVKDLIEVLIEHYAPQFGKSPRDIRIRTIGSRSGEKLYEDLMTREEAMHAIETEEMFIILPQGTALLEKTARTYRGKPCAKVQKYSSEAVRPISKREIRKLLEAHDLLK